MDDAKGCPRSRGGGRCPPELGHRSHVPGRAWALHDFPRKLWPGRACEGTGGRGLFCPWTGPCPSQEPRGPAGGGTSPGLGPGLAKPLAGPPGSIAWLSANSLRGSMSPVPSTGGIRHLLAQTRSWCPHSPPESPAQAAGCCPQGLEGVSTPQPHTGHPRLGTPPHFCPPSPRDTSCPWGGAGTELGTALQDHVNSPQQCPWGWLGLGGTRAVPRVCPSSRSLHCALMPCRAPRSHRDWNRPPRLGAGPWGPSPPPLPAPPPLLVSHILQT